jgi:hypothetical protein
VTQPDEENVGTIWIRTEPDLTGTYRLKIEINDDRGQFLTADEARAYGEYVLAQTVLADYDSMVFRQLTAGSKDPRAAADVIQDLRKDRVPARSPLSLALRPGVNMQGKPFMTVVIDGKDVGQWSIPDAREHALRILEGVQRADLDEQYRRTLVSLVGLDDATARRAVEGLATYGDE